MLSSDHQSVQRAERDVDWQNDGILPNVEVVVWMKDSLSHKGVFKGIMREPGPSYQNRYAAWQTQLETSALLPNLDDSVKVTLLKGSEKEGLFHGLDKSKNGEAILYIGWQRDGIIPIQDVTLLKRATGQIIDQKELRDILAKRKPPYRSVLVLEKEGQALYLNPEDVSQVDTLATKDRSGLLALGILVDVAILVIILSQLNKIGGVGSGTVISS